MHVEHVNCKTTQLPNAPEIIHSVLQMTENHLNETYFSVLQDFLLDRHGEEIIFAKDQDVARQGVLSEDTTIFSSTVCTWILALICSAMVGLSGLLPVFFTPDDAIQTRESKNKHAKDDNECKACDSNTEKPNLTSNIKSNNNNVNHLPSESKSITNDKLKLMLSFAVGGLLGDVFLHLLPEAHHKLYLKASEMQDPVKYIQEGHITIGLWILFGILTFIFVEMIFSINKNNEESEDKETIHDTISNRKDSSKCEYDNSHNSVINKSEKNETSLSNGDISISGYLNLLANCVDNFSHGLAVGGAFLIGPKVGVTTTLCILVHEIPHEIGDFAILIKSGFNRYEAAKAQLSTASIGICGALLALALDTFLNTEGGNDVENYTSWIIPFTCGGFINISLVTVLPDIMESPNLNDCLRTLSGIGFGVSSMMLVSSL